MLSSLSQPFKLSYYREYKGAKEALPQAMHDTYAVMLAVGQRFHFLRLMFSSADIVGEAALAELIDCPEFRLPPELVGHCFCFRVEREQFYDWYVFGAVLHKILVLPKAPIGKVGIWEWKAARLVGQSYADQWLSEPTADWLAQQCSGSYVMTIAPPTELSLPGTPSQSVGARWKGVLVADLAQSEV